MYRRIVLAVDPEGLAESVLPVVAALARRGGGEVLVVGAAKAGDPPEQRAALEKHVREAAGELNAAGGRLTGKFGRWQKTPPLQQRSARPVMSARPTWSRSAPTAAATSRSSLRAVSAARSCLGLKLRRFWFTVVPLRRAASSHVHSIGSWSRSTTRTRLGRQ